MTDRHWSDRLSPVIVKEIRQGVRGNVFVGAFLITQLLMVCCVFLGVQLIADQRNSEAATVFFWALVALPLLFIMPARGLQAVSSEIRDSTIDLIFLSRLSAWRIVLGKWAALSAQSVLLVTSLLPYMVLRYFLGSINLLQELLILGAILLVSMIMTAAAVALSAFQPRGRRTGNVATVFTVIILMFMMTSVLPVVAFAVLGHGGGGLAGLTAADYLNMYLVLVILGPITSIFLLQFGASRIAPEAENHAARKRLTALAACAAGAVLNYFEVAKLLPISLAAVITAITVMDAVCEPVPKIYSVYLPFYRRSLPGRLFGRLFSPGWASGALFSVLLITVIFSWAALDIKIRADLRLSAYLATLGVVFFPLALIRLVAPGLDRPLPAYCAIQAVTAVVTSVSMLITQIFKTNLLTDILSVIPLSFVLLQATPSARSNDFFYVGGSIILAACAIILFWRIRGEFINIDRMVAPHLAPKSRRPIDASSPEDGG